MKKLFVHFAGDENYFTTVIDWGQPLVELADIANLGDALKKAFNLECVGIINFRRMEDAE